MSDLEEMAKTDRLMRLKEEVIIRGKEAEIARLGARLDEAQIVCDSYAKENQQFSDTIDRLRAALEEIIRKFDYEVAHELLEIARKALAKEGE